jgi:hypothetical protein
VQRYGAERKSTRSSPTPFATTQLLRQIFPWINFHHELLDAIVCAL